MVAAMKNIRHESDAENASDYEKTLAEFTKKNKRNQRE